MTPVTQSATRDTERKLHGLVAPVATLLMILLAALIWGYGAPRLDSSLDAVPECAPPRGQNVTT